MALTEIQTTPFADAAHLYVEAGWRGVLPLPAGKKSNPPTGFTGDVDRWPTDEEIQRWARTAPAGNIGLRLPDDVVGIDVDHYDAKNGADELAELEDRLGPLPASWFSTARAWPSAIRFYRVPPGTTFKGTVAPCIEAIQHHHRYAVVWPSTNPKAGGAVYRWYRPDGEVADRPPSADELAELPPSWCEYLADRPAQPTLPDPGDDEQDDLHREVRHHEQPDLHRDHRRERSTDNRAAAVNRVLADALVGIHGNRHDTATEAALALVRLRETGALGADDALGDLRDVFVRLVTGDGSRSATEARHEFDSIVTTAEKKVAASNRTKLGHPGLRAGPRGGIVTASLGEVLRDELGIVLGEDGRLYRYHRGVYLPDGEAAVRHRTRELLGDRFRKTSVEEVLAWLRSDHPVIGGQPGTDFLNVTNGMLNWRTGELVDHDPNYRSVWQLPVRWAAGNLADGAGEVVLGFLEEVLPADAVEFALELVGYCIYPGNPFRKAVLALGPGANGKSTFLNTVKALIGPEFCSSVPLQTLAENRFAGAELYGKAANIAGDLDARAIKRSDLFKTITGGDAVHAERKFAHPFTFVSWALPLFSANEPPLSSDQTEAWFDRWIILPFNRRFGPDEIDPGLGAKLTAPTELEALLVFAVEGLRRLMDRGRFELPASIGTAQESYRERLDTVAGFVGERCTFDPECWLPKPELYRTYKEWATEGGRYALSAATFNEHLGRYANRLGIELQEVTRRGTRGWAGLGWAER